MDVRILEVPIGEYSPAKHGVGFSPYAESRVVWVLQCRTFISDDGGKTSYGRWDPIPVVRYEEGK